MIEVVQNPAYRLAFFISGYCWTYFSNTLNMEAKIIHSHPIIEEILSAHAGDLKHDLEKYKNHVYRIFNYALFLNKYREEEKFAISAAFHDLGIWTAKTFDYIEPSVRIAEEYVRKHHPGIDSEEISSMIINHHKVSGYKGIYQETVENFRRADWADVSMGIVHHEIPRKFIKESEEIFPYLRFHRKLVSLFFKHFVKHPLDPLPMFRK